MNQSAMTFVQGLIVEEEVLLTLGELCQASSSEEELLAQFVFEGILEPVGQSPQDWRFGGDSLRRARLAQRLATDLEIAPPGLALIIDLLDEIAALNERINRAVNRR